MSLLSRTAMGLVLALGPVALIAAPPALAQKKKGKEVAAAQTGPALKLTKEFRAAAGPLDTAYKASDWRGTLTAADAIEATATTPDDKFQLNQYRLSAAANLKDSAAQARAIEALLATGLVPAADQAKYQYFAGKFAYERNDYAKALTALAAAEAGGYVNTDVHLTRSKAYSSLNQHAQALASLEKAVAAEQAATGKVAPEEWYKFGFGQAYKGKLNAEFTKWSMMHVRAYPTPENWRSALVNFRDTAQLGGKAELDVYRLMRASKALTGEKDHYDYAYIANNAGLPGEAKTVIDQFKASGGTAGKYVNELLSEVSGKAAGDRAGLAGEEKRAAAAANGVPAAAIAHAYLGYGDYAKAAALFQTALSKGGVDNDEVNTRLGIALAMQGQKEAARSAFAAVRGPRASVAQYWTAWLDMPTA